MNGAVAGIMSRKVTLPSRGERVAAWVERRLKTTGMTLSELAFQAQVDKRDLQRLFRDKSCGWRLEDDLAAFFGWDFTEAVMTPVHGADPLTAREKAVEQQLAQAAALNARLERERAARAAHDARLGELAPKTALRGVSARREPRAFDQPAPEPA
jgi:hypothetical protein